jgi:hypothetical protein
LAASKDLFKGHLQNRELCRQFEQAGPNAKSLPVFRHVAPRFSRLLSTRTSARRRSDFSFLNRIRAIDLSHEQAVAKFPVHKCRVAQYAFLDEANVPIERDGAGIVGMNES